MIFFESKKLHPNLLNRARKLTMKCIVRHVHLPALQDSVASTSLAALLLFLGSRGDCFGCAGSFLAFDFVKILPQICQMKVPATAEV